MERQGSEKTREVKLWKTPVKMAPEARQLERNHAQLPEFLHHPTAHPPLGATPHLHTVFLHNFRSSLRITGASFSLPRQNWNNEKNEKAEGKFPSFQTGVAKSKSCNLSS